MPPLASGASSQRYQAGHGLARLQPVAPALNNKISNQSPLPFDRCTSSLSKPGGGEPLPKVPQLNLYTQADDGMVSGVHQPVERSLASPGSNDMIIQRGGHTGIDDRPRIGPDPTYHKIKDSSEILNSEKDFRSRPEDSLP